MPVDLARLGAELQRGVEEGARGMADIVDQGVQGMADALAGFDQALWGPGCNPVPVPVPAAGTELPYAQRDDPVGAVIEPVTKFFMKYQNTLKPRCKEYQNTL